eukprot:8144967-Ditylum_brightwellii.AAC.2
MYMHVPQVFEKYYPSNVVLLLLRTIHGSKQAAMVFWKELLNSVREMEHKRNGANPYLYFKWRVAGLAIWLSWIDDCMLWGPAQTVPAEATKCTDRFDCNEVSGVE